MNTTTNINVSHFELTGLLCDIKEEEIKMEVPDPCTHCTCTEQLLLFLPAESPSDSTHLDKECDYVQDLTVLEIDSKIESVCTKKEEYESKARDCEHCLELLANCR